MSDDHDRPAGRDLFISMTEEEFAAYQGPTEEDILEALAEGRRQRELAERWVSSFETRRSR